jgi:hypothetical protein
VQGRRSAWILLVGFLAATAAGYWISSVVGIELLTRELETQLTSILAGPVQIGRAGLAIEGGLFVQGESVAVYPDSTAIRGSRLNAKRVTAEIDLFALATGRFRLSGLILEDATLDIRRDEGGTWYPYPVQALADLGAQSRSMNPEVSLEIFSSFESVTRTLLAAPIAADRIELRRGRVLFRDESRSRDRNDQAPVVLSLNGIDGVLIHHWLSGEAKLKLSGNLLDGDGHEIPVQVLGENNGAGEYRARINSADFQLKTLDPYLSTGDESTWPEGSLTGSIDYLTDSKKTGRLAIDWTIAAYHGLYPLKKRKDFEIRRDSLRLAGIAKVEDEAISLTGSLLDNAGIKIGMDAEVSRPLGESSQAQMSAKIHGLDIATLREFFEPLAFTAGDQLMQLRTGRAEKIALTGTLSLRDWERLYSGELDRLPGPVNLSGELANFEISSDGGDSFTQLAGRLELRGDTFLLRRGRGLQNGEPLPALDVRITGFSNIFDIAPHGHSNKTEPSSFPGLDPLFKLFGEGPSAPDALHSPGGPSPDMDPISESETEALPFRIWIDRLEHPSLPWTVREADLQIVPGSKKARFQAESMILGGVPLAGELVWTTAPAKQIQLVVHAAPSVRTAETPPRIQAPDPKSAENDILGESNSDPTTPDMAERPPVVAWVSGRIEVPGLETGLIPLQALEADFSVLGSSLFLTQFRANLEPRGSLNADIELNLSHPDSVPVALTFSIEDADMNRLGEVFSIRSGDITGTLQLKGSLAGDLHPGLPLLDGLTGTASMQAHQGALGRQEIPILLALAQASEGYNEYAEQASIPYESMTADVQLNDQRIVTRNFELEGPLRIYASGSLDVVHPPYDLIGVAGLFLFRGAGQLLEAIPLVKIILPGSERGLVGTYYQVSGNLSDPQVRSLPGRSFAEGLPDALEAPYQILRAILSGGQMDEGKTSPEIVP